MERPPPPVPLESLLAHRDWVRRLARALVRDPNAADDLEQGVWLDALERPPRSGGSLRGWLGSALRHNLVDLRRSEARRRAREESREPSAPPPPPDEVVARAEAHAQVVAAVVALPEPYRSTVLLRYFDDLDSPAISRRMGVTPEAVRTRLARAVAMLRERLDAGSEGGRERPGPALAILAGGPGGARTPPAGRWAGPSAGGVAMKASTGVAAAAGVLLAGGLAWWMLGSDPGDPGGDPRSGAVPTSRPAAPAVAPAEEDPDPRREPPDPAPPPEPGEPAGSTTPPEEPTPRKRIARDRLPRLPGVDPLPAEGERLEVEVDGEGCVTVGGRIVPMEEFAELLTERADGTREEAEPRLSRLEVVLRADRDLLWQGAQWLMQACAHPAVRVHRIHFAAANMDGTAEGTIPTFLPTDAGRPARNPAPAVLDARDGTETTLDRPTDDRVPVQSLPEMMTVRLHFEALGDPVTAEDLLAYLEETRPDLPAKDPVVNIDAAPAVPLRAVLETVDAVRRWGARTVQFKGTRSFPGYALDSTLAATPPPTGVPAITVLGKRVPPR